jgi:glycosyltransferase involved in cell wall biosynthesis
MTVNANTRPIKRVGHVTTDHRPAVGGAEIYVSELIGVLAPLVDEQLIFQLDNTDHDATLETDPRVVLIPRLPEPWKWRRGPNLYHFNHGLRRKRVRDRLGTCDLLIVHYPFHWPPVAWHPRVIAVSHCVEWRQPPKKLTHRRRKQIARRCDREVQGLVANDTNFWREMGRDVAPKSKLWETLGPRRWCLPNGVDTEIFSPAIEPLIPDRLKYFLSRGTEAQRPFVLVPRNASPHRGIHLAIEALGRAAANHPDLVVVVAGTHPSPKYRKMLDETTASFGIRERVAYLGHVPREEMPGLYRAAAIAMVPTIRHEGTSLSALEAMACGTATITSDHGGLADLPGVQTKADGKLLAKAIEVIWHQREDYGAKQRAVVEEKFSLRRWENAWMRVVKEVMGTEKRD